MNTKAASLFFTLSSLILVGYILIIGQSIIMPFVIAVFLWYLIKSLAHKIQSLTSLTSLWAKLASVVVIFGAIVLFVDISKDNVKAFIDQAPVYQDNISQFIGLYAERFGAIDKTVFQDLAAKINFGKLAAGIVSAIGNVTTMTVTIILYLAFLFLEEKTFHWKMDALFPGKKERKEIGSLIKEIGQSFEHYIGLKTAASVAMGVMGYGVLLSIGVDNAIFWALIFGVLNFVPYLGPVIGTVLPVMAAIVQFGSFGEAGIVALGLGAIAFVIGNIIEPKLFGNSLNLSPLVFMISLAVWGSLWGIIGMILCIPIMVGIMITLSKFKATKNLSLLMAERKPN